MGGAWGRRGLQTGAARLQPGPSRAAGALTWRHPCTRPLLSPQSLQLPGWRHVLCPHRPCRQVGRGVLGRWRGTGCRSARCAGRPAGAPHSILRRLTCVCHLQGAGGDELQPDHVPAAPAGWVAGGCRDHLPLPPAAYRREPGLAGPHPCPRPAPCSPPPAAPSAVPPGRRAIYQSIFLDDTLKQHWTVGEIDPVGAKGGRTAHCMLRRCLPRAPACMAAPQTSPPPCPCLQSKVLKTRVTRQFAHTWWHFAAWVPWVRGPGGLPAASCGLRGLLLPCLPLPAADHIPSPLAHTCYRSSSCRGGATHGTQVPTRCSTHTRLPP